MEVVAPPALAVRLLVEHHSEPQPEPESEPEPESGPESSQSRRYSSRRASQLSDRKNVGRKNTLSSSSPQPLPTKGKNAAQKGKKRETK